MMKFKTNSFIKRYHGNPILSSDMIPYESTLTFNAGVTKFNGKYVMLFRNDYGFGKSDMEAWASGAAWPEIRTNIGVAFSNNGLEWEIQQKPCLPIQANDEIKRVYDPRLTVIDGRCYVCFAVDTVHGIRGGIAVTDDFDKFELLSLSTPDNRNIILFPEKINERYIRLERPFPIYGRDADEAFDIWMSASPDLQYWGESELLLGAENVPFSNCKIGPAAPPVKTEKGWLTTIHAVWKYEERNLNSWGDRWKKEYFGGLMLLDLNDPLRIIGMYREPLLVAEKNYEIEGYRGSVIFPGGMILEDNGEVKIYYGAADTVECMVTADVNDLLSLCLE